MKKETYKGYEISFVKNKNYGLIFITDIVNKDLKHTIDPSGEDFKRKSDAFEYAKILINKNGKNRKRF